MLVVKVAKVGHTANFVSTTGTDMKMINFSIADSTMALAATLSDETKFNKIREGRTIQVRNFMTKNGRICLTQHSKIMMQAPIEIGEDIMKKAEQLLSVESPRKSIQETLQSPKKQVVTVYGKVLKVQFPLFFYSISVLYSHLCPYLNNSIVTHSCICWSMIVFLHKNWPPQ